MSREKAIEQVKSSLGFSFATKSGHIDGHAIDLVILQDGSHSLRVGSEHELRAYELAISLQEQLNSQTEEMEKLREAAKPAINALCAEVHKQNVRWWVDLESGEPLKRNVGELLMLCVSELAEAMEGHRKSLPDDKLPHRQMLEVELADCVIRIFDIAAGFNLDLGGAYAEKLAYNQTRIDHTEAHRKSAHGKKY